MASQRAGPWARALVGGEDCSSSLSCCSRLCLDYVGSTAGEVGAAAKIRYSHTHPGQLCCRILLAKREASQWPAAGPK